MNYRPIQPLAKPVHGAVTVPGSKSMTNRALLLAALTEQKIRLEGVLFSRDSQLLVEALRQLGFSIEAHEAATDGPANTLTIQGCGGGLPCAEARLQVGNAGTVARFLTAFLCLHPGGRYYLDGDEAMRRRPMAGLLQALAQLGAEFQFHGQTGCFPFTLSTRGLRGGKVLLDASESSQLLSALLMAAPYAREPLQIELSAGTVSHPFIQMTLEMMRQFGIDGRYDLARGRFQTERGCYRRENLSYAIEPDATAASYFLLLPALVGGSLLIEGLRPDGLQGDIGFIDILRHLGQQIELHGRGVTSYSGGPLGGGTFCFQAISDTFLTLAAAAPLASAPIVIHGIGHTRKQETDRIEAMAAELRRLGQRVTVTEDSLAVQPIPGSLRQAVLRGESLVPARIQTYEDHRVAMSFGMLGSVDLLGDGRPWLHLHDPECCRKTFPRYFEVLESLRYPNDTSYANR